MAYPIVRVLFAVNDARQRREATLAELTDYVSVLRSNQWDIDSVLTFEFEAAIAQLEQTLLPDLETPQLFSAYVSPANMANHPSSTRSITVWWLEDGFTVDGVALHIDGQPHSKIVGWGQSITDSDGNPPERFGNRYDRYLVADVLVNESDEPVRDVGFVLNSSELQQSLEIELLTSKPTGAKIPVHVGGFSDGARTNSIR
ncbi:hypothetical protein K227x_53390 [Rubripirellula lacrimiformis]|uniref:Uncharacterized protein n=1 Tax=Rubripirellula lacrimiformis TaxID=1930273 RepID=A0A517NIF2_9BACT|nr:hypothetical protein [Rubripirellula lacrimiformis]QDT06915.1 hypothetical protein K227x_53390 [Rubripirellula lacrimiformis]